MINETENGSLSASNIIAGGVIGRITGGTSYMMLKNDHGDVVGLTTNGEVKADYTYSAYGELIAGESNGINNPIRYAGEYTDEESGLIYLRARYYDPGLGRFISEDPIRDGMNWYAYCAGNPVMMVDPSGMWRDIFTFGPKKDVIDIYSRDQDTILNHQYIPFLAIDKYKDILEQIDKAPFSIRSENLIYYNVPLFLQGSTNRCVPYSRVMVKAYKSGKIMTQEEAEIEVEKDVQIMKKNGNFTESGGTISVSGKYYTKNISDITKFFQNGPIMVRYRSKSGGTGHFVVATGYMKVNGEEYFMINDPANESISGRWLNKEEFRTLGGDKDLEFDAYYATDFIGG